MYKYYACSICGWNQQGKNDVKRHIENNHPLDSLINVINSANTRSHLPSKVHEEKGFIKLL